MLRLKFRFISAYIVIHSEMREKITKKMQYYDNNIIFVCVCVCIFWMEEDGEVYYILYLKERKQTMKHI
jgi:hypothetical protein